MNILKKVKDELKDKAKQECSICHNEMFDKLGKTECGHLFHLGCIKQWIETKRNRADCPNCRKNVTIASIKSVSIVDIIMDYMDKTLSPSLSSSSSSAVKIIDEELIKAINEGNINRMKKCILEGANVNAIDNNGCPALILSIQKSHIEIVKQLILNGVNINAPTKDGWTGLMWAINEGQNRYLEIIKQLILNNANVNDSKDGKTILMLAVKKGNIDFVNELIKAKADVNAINNDGVTALIIAINNGYIEIANQLILAGTNINIVSLNHGTALIQAVLGGHTEIVIQLILREANINASNKDGWTALIFATNKRQIEIIKLLIVARVNINAKSKDNKTALRYAVEWGYNDISDLLRKFGAV